MVLVMTTLNNEKLKIENITAGYDDEIIIKDISMSIAQGEIASIIGLSGVGKTTLFNVIAGLLKAYSGQVYLNSEDITGQTGKVSYMLQNDMLLPFYTILDNIALPLIIKHIPKEKARAEVMKHLEGFDLTDKAYCYPDELSGGMRQRAALLRTYMFSAEFALLDEPFSALDSITRRAIHEWYMKIMQELKLSTILITHDIDEAILLSDKIYVLSGKPARISHCFDIPLKRPRNNIDDDFINIKKNLLSALECSHSAPF